MGPEFIIIWVPKFSPGSQIYWSTAILVQTSPSILHPLSPDSLERPEAIVCSWPLIIYRPSCLGNLHNAKPAPQLPGWTMFFTTSVGQCCHTCVSKNSSCMKTWSTTAHSAHRACNRELPARAKRDASAWILPTRRQHIAHSWWCGGCF